MKAANGDTLEYGLLPVTAYRCLVYSSNGTVSTIGGGGANGAARASLLPASVLDGKAYFKIPANAMPAGSAFTTIGFGNVNAALAVTFTLFPWFQTVENGTKTDLPSGGTQIMIAAGVTAVCSFVGTVQQVNSTQVLVSGFVTYAPQNNTAISLEINPNGTLVNSDPTVDRWFGFDAQWGTSNANNVENTLGVTTQLMTTYSSAFSAQDILTALKYTPLQSRTAGSLNVVAADVQAALNSAWISYIPSVLSGSGTITTVGTVIAAYKIVGTACHLRISLAITTNGTASYDVRFTLPFNSVSDFAGVGREVSVTGKSVTVSGTTGTNTALINNYDNSYAGGNGYKLVCALTYEISPS